MSKDLAHILKKSKQSEKILTKLWERRLSILLTFYKTKKKDNCSQEDLHQIFTGVLETSRRERKVIDILEKGIESALLTLNNSIELTPNQKSMFSPRGISELHQTVINLTSLFQDFKKILEIYKILHDVEESIANEMNDEKLNVYKSLIENLNNSIITLINKNQEITSSEKFLSQTNLEIKEIKKVLEKKNLKEYIGPSIVSAVFRVFTTTILSAMSMGTNPLESSEFWDFTLRITSLVVVVNYIDYTFNTFTALTQKTSKLLGIMK